MHADLAGDDLGQPVEDPAGEFVLERPDHRRWLVRHGPGQVQRGRNDFLRRQHGHAGSAPAQLGAGHRPSGQHHLGGQGGAEALLQDVGGAHARGEAVAGEVRAVHRRVAEDDHVAVAGERQSPAGGVPGGGGDDRPGAAQDALVHERGVGERALALGQRPQGLGGAAHAEYRAVAGDHHRTYVVAPLDLRERVPQSREQPVGEHRRAHRHQRDALVQDTELQVRPVRDDHVAVDGRWRARGHRDGVATAGPGAERAGRAGASGVPAADPAGLLRQRAGRQRYAAGMPVRVAGGPVDRAAADPVPGHLVQVTGPEGRHRIAGGGRAGGHHVPGVRTAGEAFQRAAQRVGAGRHDGDADRLRRPSHLRRVGDVADAPVRGEFVEARRNAQPADRLHPDQVRQPRRVEPEIAEGRRRFQRLLGYAEKVGHRRGRAGRLRQAGRHRARVRPQCLGGRRGEHHERRPVRRGCGGGGELLDQHVRVGAPGAERADAGPPRYAGRRSPRLQRALDPQRHGGEVDVRVEFLGVQRRHERAVPQLQQHLRQAGYPGGALQVPDVRLDRADRARPGRQVRTVERLPEALDLDRVAERGAGAVGLDVAQRGGCPAGRVQRGADERGLGAGARYCRPGGTSGVVHRRRADDAVHVVAVGERARQRLEQHRADPLAGHVAGAVRAERAAPAVGGQPLPLRELEVLLRVHCHVHAAGQGERALAPPDALDREVHGHQRRRAGGVDGQARPGQVEGVRDAVGDRAVHRGRGDAVGGPADELVVVPHDARVDADDLAAQGLGRMSGVLQGVPAGGEEQPFLGVHPLGVAPGHPEEGRREAVDAVEEAAPPAVRTPGGALLRVEQRRMVPAAGGHLGDRVDAAGQVAPERVQVVRAGVTPGHADHRDRVVARPAHGRLTDGRSADGRSADGRSAVGPGSRARDGGSSEGRARGGGGRSRTGGRHEFPQPVRLPVQDQHRVVRTAQHVAQDAQRGVGGHRLLAGVLGRAAQGVGGRAHAALGPVRPADDDGPAATAPLDVPQARVGVRVGGLTGVGHVGRSGGEGDQEVERVTGGGGVDVAQAVEFGGGDGGEVARIAAEEQPVPGDAGAVQDPVDPAEPLPYTGHRRVHSGGVGDVGDRHVHLGARRAAPVDERRRGRGARQQGDPGPVPPREVRREDGGETAGSPGDQIDAAVAERLPARGPGGRVHLAPPPHETPAADVADLRLGVAHAQFGAYRGGEVAGVIDLDEPAAQAGDLGGHGTGQRRGRRLLGGGLTGVHDEQVARSGVDEGGGGAPQVGGRVVGQQDDGGRQVRGVAEPVDGVHVGGGEPGGERAAHHERLRGTGARRRRVRGHPGVDEGQHRRLGGGRSRGGHRRVGRLRDGRRGRGLPGGQVRGERVDGGVLEQQRRVELTADELLDPLGEPEQRDRVEAEVVEPGAGRHLGGRPAEHVRDGGAQRVGEAVRGARRGRRGLPGHRRRWRGGGPDRRGVGRHVGEQPAYQPGFADALAGEAGEAGQEPAVSVADRVVGGDHVAGRREPFRARDVDVTRRRQRLGCPELLDEHRHERVVGRHPDLPEPGQRRGVQRGRVQVEPGGCGPRVLLAGQVGQERAAADVQGAAAAHRRAVADVLPYRPLVEHLHVVVPVGGGPQRGQVERRRDRLVGEADQPVRVVVPAGHRVVTAKPAAADGERTPRVLWFADGEHDLAVEAVGGDDRLGEHCVPYAEPAVVPAGRDGGAVDEVEEDDAGKHRHLVQPVVPHDEVVVGEPEPALDVGHREPASGLLVSRW